MPEFEIASPDGKKYRINAPEGATPDQVRERLRMHLSQSAAPKETPLMLDQERTEQRRIDRARQNSPEPQFMIDAQAMDAHRKEGLLSFPEFALSGTPMGRIVSGAADIPLGLSQKVINAFDVDDPEQFNQFMQEREGYMDRGKEAAAIAYGAAPDDNLYDKVQKGRNRMGATIGRPVGNIASTVAAPLFNPVTNPTTVPGMIGQGALLGAGGGVSMPSVGTGEEPLSRSDVLRDTAVQGAVGTVAGGALGPVIPLAVQGGSKLANTLRTAFSTEEKARKVLQGTAGDRRFDVADLLDDYAANPGQTLTPRTAGEVATPAGSAEFAGLQRLANNRLPSDDAAARKGRTEARAAVLREIGQDEPALNAAREARTNATQPLYDQARESPAYVDTEGAVGSISQMLRDHSREDAIIPLQQLKERLHSMLKFERDGELVEEAWPVLQARDAISARRQINAMIQNKGTVTNPLDNEAVARLIKIRDEFDTALEDTLPEFRQANETFRDMSVPVNRMEVGQHLERSLNPGINEFAEDAANQRATSFTNALRDPEKVARDATGFKRGDIRDIMAPEQMDRINEVGADLGSEAAFERLANRGLAQARTEVGSAFNLEAPHIMERTFVLANSALSRFNRGSQEKTMEYLARIMRNDPAKVAEILRRVPWEEGQAIRTLISAMRQGNPALLGTSTGGAIGEEGEQYVP